MSQMIGFTVRTVASSTLAEVQCDERELEAAAWYCKQQIHAALSSSGTNGELHFPGKASLARRLINDWATS
jgi:NADH pyrophosphatase NudC (nudix superfamily)